MKTETDEKWVQLLIRLKSIFGKTPDLNAILFLIGVQELGQGVKHFSKEQKQDLMHIAICKLLSLRGYYEFEGTDQEGWPHWKATEKLPHLDVASQEKLLKTLMVEYFSDEVFEDL